MNDTGAWRRTILDFLKRYIPDIDWRSVYVVVSFTVAVILMEKWGKPTIFIRDILVPLRDGTVDGMADTLTSFLEIPIIGWILYGVIYPLYGVEQLLYNFSLTVPLENGNSYFILRQSPDINLAAFLYWFGMTFTCLFLIPVLSIKLVLRKKLSDFGFVFRGKREHLLVLILYILFLIILIPASMSEAFHKSYPLAEAVQFSSWERFNPLLLFVYELGFLMYWIAWEFGFRGYLLFGLYEKMGDKAILVGLIPFVWLHLGKPELEVFASIIAAFILAVIALRARSVMPCILLHFMVAFTMDVLSIFWRITL